MRLRIYALGEDQASEHEPDPGSACAQAERVEGEQWPERVGFRSNMPESSTAYKGMVLGFGPAPTRPPKSQPKP